MTKHILSIALVFGLSLNAILATELKSHQGKFTHPGMAQSAADLEYMRQQVNKRVPQWKTSFENLRQQTDTSFVPKAQTHISVGPYGANDNGGAALSRSAEMAYNCALMWYLTSDGNYARKAIEIINSWSSSLWDFDDNNAKLLVGLSGHYFLNAAEILRYTNSGWKKHDAEQFESLMLLVYYPYIENFFTEANGNWDAAMINTMLCIGVFTDNQEIFNKALDRFYFGPGNSGITRYIYSSGQVQEATRDWAHVQLGIGELAKAAAVAWTQGIDLYQVADNRLAKGFEHAAKFLTGNYNIPVYGVISLREKDKIRDIYESIEDHYSYEKRIKLPYTNQLINKRTRSKSSTGFLTAKRSHNEGPLKWESLSYQSLPAVKSLVGATLEVRHSHKKGIEVRPGESVQQAIDRVSGTDQWVILKAGIHQLDKPVFLKSNVKITGEGRETILHLSPNVQGYTLINKEADFRNIVIENLLIEGAVNVKANNDPNHDRRSRSYMSAASRGGISLMAETKGQAGSVRLKNVTVQNCTKNGVVIKGASNVEVIECDISDNGGSIVPGAGLNHNLVLSRLLNCSITSSRF